MKRHLLTLIILLASVALSFGQRNRSDAWKTYRHEVGLGLGYNTVYSGLGENSGVGVRTILQRSTFGGNYRFFVFRFLSVKAMANHGYTRKNDKEGDQADRPNNLRIDYKSSFTEFGGVLEFHLFDETGMGSGGRQRRARGGIKSAIRLGISAYAGLSYSIIRPYGEYFGDRIELKPLPANPESNMDVSSYDRGYLHIPVGLNLRYVIDKNWRLGLDLGYRIGFKEYIDNVSGVYYRDEGASADAPSLYENEAYVGVVTYGDSQEPVTSLVSGNGKKNYFVGLLTLSYRLKL